MASTSVSRSTPAYTSAREIEEASTRMKALEAVVDDALRLDGLQPFIMRLDGHCFHTFTKGMRKPFDERLHSALVATTSDLVEYFQPSTAYCQSDEISLFFPPITIPVEEQTTPAKDALLARDRLMFGGRIQKIVSVAASYCAARFNYHLAQQPFGNEEIKIAKRVMSSVAHFDSRVFSVPDAKELWRNLHWRGVMDCQKNSVSALGQAHIHQKALHGLHSLQILEKLEKEKGIHWEDEPDWARWGTIVKKEHYRKVGVDLRTGKEVPCMRTRVVARSMDLGILDDNVGCALVVSKLWNDWLSDS